MRTTRTAYAALLLIVALLALCLHGCRSARPAPNATQLPRNSLEKPQNDSINPSYGLQTPKGSGTEYHANATQTTGILSGIGQIFSTPAGTANRQAVRLARASVPKKIGKGAVYAPKATEVVNAYKPKAAVVNADSGAVVTTIEKVKAPVAIGHGATATSTTSKGLSWWWLLVPAAGLALWLYRKTIPFA